MSELRRSLEKATKDWPRHEPVEILFTDEGVYVNTGDQYGGLPGTIAYAVKKEQADAILQAFKDAARYRWLRSMKRTENELSLIIAGEPDCDYFIDEAMKKTVQNPAPQVPAMVTSGASGQNVEADRAKLSATNDQQAVPTLRRWIQWFL